MTAAAKKAIRHPANTDDEPTYSLKPRGDALYEEVEIPCPHCQESTCAVHIASMHIHSSPNGSSKSLMYACWTACGWAFELRLMSGVCSMRLTIFNLHARRDVRADPASFTVIDPPPAWTQYLKEAS